LFYSLKIFGSKPVKSIMVDGFAGFKSPTSTIESGRDFLFRNCLKTSFISVAAGFPDILAEVPIRGSFVFSSKSFTNLYFGILKAIVSPFTPYSFALAFLFKTTVVFPGQTSFKNSS